LNYTQILRDSLRLFRTTKLLWVFGFLSFLPLSLIQLLYVPNNTILICLYSIVTWPILFVTFVASGSLIYVIHQALLNKTSAFSEAWHKGRSKILRVFVLMLVLSIPIVLLFLFFSRIIVTTIPRSPLTWLFALTNQVVIGSFFTFGLCAIMIDNIEPLEAAWTGFLITRNNFFPLFIITGIIFFTRIFLQYLLLVIFASGPFNIELPVPLAQDYPTYLKLTSIPIMVIVDGIFNMFFVPLTSIVLTLGYLEFTEKIAYPLIKRQSTTQENI
jgi:hypothetical protein